LVEAVPLAIYSATASGSSARQDANKRMKDKAAHACQRVRVRRKGMLAAVLKGWSSTSLTGCISTEGTNNERSDCGVFGEGFAVRPMYSGGSAAGDFIVSEGTQADDFLALGTTSHGTNTCALRFDKADTANLALVSGALRQKGFYSNAIEAAGHPIHPPADNRYMGNERYSPTYMTPSHGTIAWKTNVSNPRPNLVTAVRSPIVNGNLRFAQLDDGRWTFDMGPPVDLRSA
jgi:hypothetical protein